MTSMKKWPMIRITHVGLIIDGVSHEPEKVEIAITDVAGHPDIHVVMDKASLLDALMLGTNQLCAVEFRRQTDDQARP